MLRIVFLLVGLCVTHPATSQGNIDAVVEIYATKAGEMGFGTGFFVDATGRIATAYHVVHNAKRIDAYDRRKQRYENLRVVAVDPTNDVALLTIGAPRSGYVSLLDQAPPRQTQLSVIGHPYGSPFQTFTARATQDGYLDSLQLMDSRQTRIFASSIPIIPLDLTVYNGMSGGPIFVDGNRVVGLISGSFNVGGSLVWGIPAKAIIALMAQPAANAVAPTSIEWPRLAVYRETWRGNSRPLSIGASQTIRWINEKWSTHGARRYQLNGFNVAISEARLEYIEAPKTLRLDLRYSYIGVEYQQQIIIKIDDAERAVAADSQRVGSSRYVLLKCPRSRACVSLEIQKKLGGTWKRLEHEQRTHIRLDSWPFVDLRTAEQVEAALNHLLALHGAPVDRPELFNKR